MKSIRYSTKYKKDIKRYDENEDVVWLERIGTHSELFK